MTPRLELTNPDRLWSKIDASGDCWIWMGARKESGYGRFGLGGRNRLAHRVVYEYLVGELQGPVDHLCRVKACVNPDHLEPVTASTNAQRSRGSTESRCPNGHMGEIIRLSSGERRCRLCHNKHNRVWRASRKVSQ